jgi:myo-inositol-1(or 4)-monophosphatase
VKQGNSVLAAAVYAPELNELYTAAADGPALCNGEPIEVSRNPALEQAMILTSVNKLLLPDPRAFALFERLSCRAQKVRILGAAGLDLCRVACGQVDGYIEAGVCTWDVEAGGLIVRRAGGEARCLWHEPGGHRVCYVASNPGIHEPLSALLDPADLPG